MVAITVEPDPDDSKADPFQLKPLIGMVPASAADHQTFLMEHKSSAAPAIKIELVGASAKVPGGTTAADGGSTADGWTTGAGSTLGTGSFSGSGGHAVSGSVKLVKRSDGKLELQLGSSFKSQMGPALYVVLSSRTAIGKSYSATTDIELGWLTQLSGKQTFVVSGADKGLPSRDAVSISWAPAPQPPVISLGLSQMGEGRDVLALRGWNASSCRAASFSRRARRSLAAPRFWCVHPDRRTRRGVPGYAPEPRGWWRIARFGWSARFGRGARFGWGASR